ncbi:MAG: hypothetical protein RJB66_1776 [Pseudomonadota bacterium]|jgi:hypothetical protein
MQKKSFRNRFQLLVLLTLVALPNLALGVINHDLLPVGKYNGFTNSLGRKTVFQSPGYVSVAKRADQSIAVELWRSQKNGGLSRIVAATIVKQGSAYSWKNTDGQSLLLESDGSCYQTDENKRVVVRLCAKQSELSLEYQSGEKQSREGLLFHGRIHGFIKDKAFYLSEIPQFAALNNFDARTRLQMLKLAQLQTKLSHENLYPHLTLGTVVNSASAGVGIGALTLLGDLVPFLFPTRWIHVHENRGLQNAQAWSLTTYRLDAAVTTQGIALLYLRDRAIVEIMKNQIHEITKIRNLTKEKEDLGFTPPGSVDNLDALLAALKHDSLILENANVNQKSQVALSMGLSSPSNLGELVDNVPIDDRRMILMDESYLMRKAVESSTEVKVIASLIEAARQSARGRYFNWIDPYADIQGGLGLGTGTFIDIGHVKVSELEVQKQQSLAAVENKIETLLNERRLILEAKEAASSNVEINTRKLKRLMKTLNSDPNFDNMNMVFALKDLTSARIQMATLDYAQKSVTFGIQRMSLTGDYEKILSLEKKKGKIY